MHTDCLAAVCKPAHMDSQQIAAKAIVEEMLRVTGLEPTNLARLAKVSPSTLTRFLGGNVKWSLSLRTLNKLSAASGVVLPSSSDSVDSRPMTVVVGYVGAGEKVYPFDDAPLGGGLEQVPSPPGADQTLVAVRVRGNSMVPVFWDGDLLFYTRDDGFDRSHCLYQECIVKIVDGPTYVKNVMPGSGATYFTLTSYNAPPLLDQAVEWAAPVLHTDRTRRRPRAALAVLTKPSKRPASI